MCPIANCRRPLVRQRRPQEKLLPQIRIRYLFRKLRSQAWPTTAPRALTVSSGVDASPYIEDLRARRGCGVCINPGTGVRIRNAFFVEPGQLANHTT
jgi:hypothetical protein